MHNIALSRRTSEHEWKCLKDGREVDGSSSDGRDIVVNDFLLVLYRSVNGREWKCSAKKKKKNESNAERKTRYYFVSSPCDTRDDSCSRRVRVTRVDSAATSSRPVRIGTRTGRRARLTIIILFLLLLSLCFLFVAGPLAVMPNGI